MCASAIYREKGLLLLLASEVFSQFSCVFLQFIEKESYTGLHQKFFSKFSCVLQQFTEKESIALACIRSFHKVFLCLSAIHRGGVYCYCMREKFSQSLLVSFSNTQRKSLLLLHA